MTVPTHGGHIFLSHSGADAKAAHELAQILRRNGLDICMDKDKLQPGDPWMATLERNIQEASAMIVYIGRLGVQTWVDREVRLGLVRNTQDPNGFRLIPVLGAGADPVSLPPFLLQQQYTDLRDPQRKPEEIGRLLNVLRSKSGQRAVPADYWANHSPFRNLQIFEPKDSWLFFGRDSEIYDLLTHLERGTVLTVLGNSGSGKSSLIGAGMIPALQRGRFHSAAGSVDSWRIAVVRPSEAPFDYLAETLPGQITPELCVTERLKFIREFRETLPRNAQELRNAIAAMVPKGKHILLVVDQFEELFTLARSEKVQHAYIDALLAASGQNGAVTVHVVLVVRADFYAHCLEHPELIRYLESNLYNVPRMSPQQLREAIEKRLALACASAEPGLIDSLLSDVGTEPGDLALLEHALGQLWEKRDSNATLMNRAYMEIGRLRGALGRQADKVCREISRLAELHLVQKVFLELVQLGEGAQDTRRRVPKEALLRLGDPNQMEQLLAHLASSRLIYVGGAGGRNFVEVSHEALIREWPALRQWLAQNREDLSLERQLVERADEWHKLERDPGSLLQGARLVQAEEWLRKKISVPKLVDEFVTASLEAKQEVSRKEREAQQRELARQQELRQQAEARASAETRLRQEQETAAVQARHSTMRLRWLSGVLACLVLVAAGAAWLAHRQQLIAESRALAAQAEEKRPEKQRVALNLALQSWHKAKTHEASVALADSRAQILITLQGHSSIVLSAAFSPDGRRILTASGDKTVGIWDAETGILLADLQHDDIVWQATFSPDGQRVVSASEDKTARIWNAETSKLLATLKHGDRVWQARFSPDGRRVVSVSKDKTARIWNAETGKLLATLKHGDRVWQASFSTNGRHIVTASADKTARVWNAESGKLLATLQHGDAVYAASFSPDGQRIATASADKTACVWNAESGKLLATLQHGNAVYEVSFSPDGQLIATASADKTARIWNAESGQLLSSLRHDDAVQQATFSPDGRRILTASSKVEHLWNVETSQLLTTFSKDGAAWQGVFSPDGQRIVTGGSYSARVWNAATGDSLVLKHDDRVWQAMFSPDGQYIVAASWDKMARVWNTQTGRLLVQLKHNSVVRWSSFSPDGQQIVTASLDRTARIWSAKTGQLLATLNHDNVVWQASFSPDGHHIVTASLDKTARVWNAATGQLLAVLKHDDVVWQASFSPDGHHIITASSDKTAQVWNAATGQSLAVLKHDDVVWQASFSPDGRHIATASSDKTARVWNATTSQLLAILKHDNVVWQASFSPDNHQIVTASLDETARVWNAETGQLLAILKHGDDVRWASFSFDGRHIVTASSEARMWDAVTGQLLAILKHEDNVRWASFSPDGQRIVTASHKYVHVWHVMTLPEIEQVGR